QELLMVHLAGDEKKVREVESLRELITEAREAMRQDCPAQPDRQAARRRFRIDRAVQWGGRIVAMAACLLIGFGIARMRPANHVEVILREKPANPAVVAVNDARPAAEGELWSAQRIYRNAIEVNRNEKPKAGTKRIFQ
ncbi:MAG TPA: hypothetical protein VGP94_10130, partial [Tepidisphaeraceae bacterium]|nr:hypothetical protein [Tepidisphaeraceae bacterium]